MCDQKDYKPVFFVYMNARFDYLGLSAYIPIWHCGSPIGKHQWIGKQVDLKAVVRIASKNQKFLLNNSVFHGIKNREMKANKTPNMVLFLLFHSVNFITC